MTDNRFSGYPVDARFSGYVFGSRPVTTGDADHENYPTDGRFPAPGLDARFEILFPPGSTPVEGSLTVGGSSGNYGYNSFTPQGALLTDDNGEINGYLITRAQMTDVNTFAVFLDATTEAGPYDLDPRNWDEIGVQFPTLSPTVYTLARAGVAEGLQRYAAETPGLNDLLAAQVGQPVDITLGYVRLDPTVYGGELLEHPTFVRTTLNSGVNWYSSINTTTILDNAIGVLFDNVSGNGSLRRVVSVDEGDEVEFFFRIETSDTWSGTSNGRLILRADNTSNLNNGLVTVAQDLQLDAPATTYTERATMPGGITHFGVRGQNGDGTKDFRLAFLSARKVTPAAPTVAQVEVLFNDILQTGPQQATTQTVGVDALPAGASIVSDYVRVFGSPVFEGWDFNNYRVEIEDSASNVVIRGCVLRNPGNTNWLALVAGQQAGGHVSEISRNTFIGAGDGVGLIRFVPIGTDENAVASVTCDLITRNAFLRTQGDMVRLCSGGVVSWNYFDSAYIQQDPLGVWDANTSFALDQVVQDPTGTWIYKSLVANNQGNALPVGLADNANWENLDYHMDQLQPISVIGGELEVFANYFNRRRDTRRPGELGGYGFGVNAALWITRNTGNPTPHNRVYAHHNIIAGGRELSVPPVYINPTADAQFADKEVTANWIEPNAGGNQFFDGIPVRHTISPNDTYQADTVVPVLSNLLDAATGETTGTFAVTASEWRGTIMWVATTSATAPTATQIENGQDHAGAAATDFGAITVLTIGSQTAGITGLTGGASYWVHAFMEDPSGNRGLVVSGSGFTSGSVFTPTTNLSAHIPEANTRALRQRLVDYHLTDQGGAVGTDNAWMGVSDETGFTVTQVTSADQLVSTMSGLSSASNHVVELDWDGISSLTSNDIAGGLTNASLTPDGSDYGYVRPSMTVLVRPASGRAPIVDCQDLYEFRFRGFPYLELRGFEVRRGPTRLTTGFNYNLGMVTAVTDMRFFDIDTASESGALYVDGSRTAHIENCSFDENQTSIRGCANFMRIWNCEFVNHYVADCIAIRAVTSPLMDDWFINVWAAGNVVYDMTKTSPAFAGGHPDFLQTTTSTDTHDGYRVLSEFNIANLDSEKVSALPGLTQGIFGDDWNGVNAYRTDWCCHNNIVASGAFQNVYAFDPSGNGEMIVYRHMALRAGAMIDDANDAIYDTSQGITGATQNSGSGYFASMQSYYGVSDGVTGQVANGAETYIGNTDINSKKANLGGAKDPRNVFDGTGVVYSLDSNGAACLRRPNDRGGRQGRSARCDDRRLHTASGLG